MENYRLTRQLDIHFSVLWGLYWAGWASLWGFLSVFLLHRGFTNAQVGLVSACALVLPVAVQPALASLADSSRLFTSRRLAMGLTALATVAGIGVWLTDSMALCAVCLVVIGVSITALAPYFNAMSMDCVLRGVDVNFGASRAVGSVTYALSNLVLGAALERFAPPLVVPVFLVCFGLLFVALWGFRYELPPLSVTARTAPTVLSNFGLLRRYPRFALLLVGGALLMAGHSSVTTYMFQIVGKVGGAEQMMGVAIFISGVVEVPAMVLFGRLRRRFSLRTLLTACAICFALRDVCLLLAGDAIGIYLAAALQFGEYAIFIPATVYYVTEELDSANQVKGQALIATASAGIGPALGTLVSGKILDAASVDGMLLFCLATAVVGTAVTVLSLRGKKR